ncbi:hypothetical protein PG990_013941 [Apiospora arundinis]
MAIFLVCSLSIVVAAILVILNYCSTLPYDPKQPPCIRPKIPIIGHMVGLLRHGTGYYSIIAEECKLPIFTLEIGKTKTYVITSPNLAAVCDRRSKVVSFAPCALNFAKRILLASEPTMRLLSENVAEEKGPVGLRVENMRAIHHSLVPGDHLNEISHTMLTHLANIFESEFGYGKESQVPLFQWIRNFVTIASTDTLYGSESNPLRDSDVMDGFWEVDRGFAFLALAVFPRILAPKASRGRERVFEGFLEYYTNHGFATASRIVKARYEVNCKYNVSQEDIARFDLGVCTGLLVNTIPATFWAVLRVFSNPDLLHELRQSLHKTACLDNAVDPSQCPIMTVSSAPFLESLVTEVLRLHSNNSSTRVLLDDVSIKDSGGDIYLLKKGSFLTVPSALFHQNETLWGLTAKTFDPARFVNHNKIRASANRTFGGGNALCPGRHFAMNEIMSFLVIVLLRFDVDPVNGSWALPESTHHISTSILTPVEDVWVKIKPREGLQDIKWNFIW